MVPACSTSRRAAYSSSPPNWPWIFMLLSRRRVSPATLPDPCDAVEGISRSRARFVAILRGRGNRYGNADNEHTRERDVAANKSKPKELAGKSGKPAATKGPPPDSRVPPHPHPPLLPPDFAPDTPSPPP